MNPRLVVKAIEKLEPDWQNEMCLWEKQGFLGSCERISYLPPRVIVAEERKGIMMEK